LAALRPACSSYRTARSTAPSTRTNSDTSWASPVRTCVLPPSTEHCPSAWAAASARARTPLAMKAAWDGVGRFSLDVDTTSQGCAPGGSVAHSAAARSARSFCLPLPSTGVAACFVEDGK